MPVGLNSENKRSEFQYGQGQPPLEPIEQRPEMIVWHEFRGTGSRTRWQGELV